MAKKELDPKDIEKKAKETAEIVEDALRNISSQIGEIFQDALDTTSSFSKTLTNDITKGINNLAKTSTTLLSNQEKLSSGSLTRSQVEKQIAERTFKVAALQQQINIAKKAGLITDEEADEQLGQALLYEKEFIDDLNKQADLADKFNKKLGVTGATIKGLNKIPVLGGLINAEKVLARIQKKTAEEGSTKFDVFKEGVKGVGSSMKDNLTDPSVLMGGGFSILAKVIQFFIEAMFAADKRVTDIAKNLSISKDSARGLYDNLKSSKTEMDTMYRTTANIAEAFNDIAQLTGFSTIATNDQIEAQIVLTKQLGQSKEEALGLQEAFAVSNIEAGKGIDIVYDQIAAFGNQNKIVADGRKIFQEVSKTSKLIQLNFRGGFESLINTTLQAKKLGLTLDQVSKVGSSLLDFESSISAEMEAELLTGKDLNLEKAREFALNHDIAGLTQEIAKNGITAEKFASMNVIQQEAIAKTLGMNANELADSLYKQQVLNKTGGVYLKQLKERAESLRNEGKENEAIKLEKEAALVEQGILEGKNLKEAQKSADAQEKFNVAVERIKEVFSDLVNGGMLDKLVDYLDQFVGSLETGSSVLGTMVFGPDSKSEIASSRKSSLEEQLKTAKDDDEKKKLQEKIKKQEEIYNAEKAKENKEALKTVGISQSEIKQIQNNEVVTAPRGPKFAEGGIITKPVSNATIGEAGPEAIIPLGELMKHFNAMNNTLNAILQKDSNVYLDGTKVGTAMNVGTYRVQ
jgi:hypothetical protein